MGHKHFTRRRAKQITDTAKRLWDDFYVKGVCPTDAFFTDDWMPPGAPDAIYGAYEFLTFCMAAVEDRTALPVGPDRVEEMLTRRNEPDKCKISRWRLLPGDDASVTILTVSIVEYFALPANGPNDRSLNRYMVWTWNLLHEAGHLILHTEHILTEGRLTLSTPLDAPVATSVEEEEAWFFASCVLGLALATQASQERDQKRFGAPWELVAWNAPNHPSSNVE